MGSAEDQFSERLLSIGNVNFRPVISADISVVPAAFVRVLSYFFSFLGGDEREEGKSRTERAPGDGKNNKFFEPLCGSVSWLRI